MAVLWTIALIVCCLIAAIAGIAIVGTFFTFFLSLRVSAFLVLTLVAAVLTAYYSWDKLSALERDKYAASCDREPPSSKSEDCVIPRTMMEGTESLLDKRDYWTAQILVRDTYKSDRSVRQRWVSPTDAGASGWVGVSATFRDKTRGLCKMLAHDVQARGRKVSVERRICAANNGTWVVSD